MTYEKIMEVLYETFGESVAEEYRDESEENNQNSDGEWWELFTTEEELIEDVALYIKELGL